MEYLKKLIKEELKRALSESYFSEQPNAIELISKDDIIYNFELGRSFAIQNLQIDINNLNRYDFVDYLPLSETEESWSFDFDTALGGLLTIDINRYIQDGSSMWSIIFGVKYKDEPYPSVKGSIKRVNGYEEFVKKVNSELSPTIDPSKY